jgi:hypothetical protein
MIYLAGEKSPVSPFSLFRPARIHRGHPAAARRLDPSWFYQFEI